MTVIAIPTTAVNIIIAIMSLDLSMLESLNFLGVRITHSVLA
jgi:hypothetical protein